MVSIWDSSSFTWEELLLLVLELFFLEDFLDLEDRVLLETVRAEGFFLPSLFSVSGLSLVVFLAFIKSLRNFSSCFIIAASVSNACCSLIMVFTIVDSVGFRIENGCRRGRAATSAGVWVAMSCCCCCCC